MIVLPIITLCIAVVALIIAVLAYTKDTKRGDALRSRITEHVLHVETLDEKIENQRALIDAAIRESLAARRDVGEIQLMVESLAKSSITMLELLKAVCAEMGIPFETTATTT